MTKFNFAPRVADHDRYSTPLGVNSGAKFADADIGKTVKLSTVGAQYIPTALNDEIEALVESIEPNTVVNGLSFGVIQIGGRAYATVTGATMAQGALCVSGTQAALGTANSNNTQNAAAGYPNVVVGTPTKFIWRIIDLLGGGGLVNTTVVIERIK